MFAQFTGFAAIRFPYISKDILIIFLKYSSQHL